VDGALKQVKALSPETAAMFLSTDSDTGKILAMAQCSKNTVTKGLKANDWCNSILSLIGGKGGGKPESAQASGSNVSSLNTALETAEKFAMEKLGVSKVSIVPVTSGVTSSGAGVSGGGSVVSGDKSSARVRLVLTTASYTGHQLQWSQSDKFSATIDSHTFTDPVSAATYLASVGGKSVKSPSVQLYSEESSVLQWLMYGFNDLGHSVSGWTVPTSPGHQHRECNPGTLAANKTATLTALQALNTTLASRTYLVGERLSLADIGIAITLLPAFTQVLDAKTRSTYRHITRWFNTVINQKEVADVVGQVKLADKEAVFVAAAGGKEKKEKVKQEKPKEKKKEEPKKKEVTKEKEPEEEPMPAPAKKADPLDPLPKGSFDLEDWKRFYSNNDEDKSCEYFWTKFDPECYSIWRGDYRYNNELTQVFMSCNLMGGMFQRLDKLNKNAFASACVFGENNNNSISAIWVFKGQELAFDLNEDWQTDYSSYEWKKLDPSAPETKTMVNQYWKWEGVDKDGRKFNQGKIFK